jgi:hypothetical protein
MLPKIAEGSANKVWIVPSEIGRALEGLGSTMSSLQGIPDKVDGPLTRVDMGPAEPDVPEDAALSNTRDEVAAAIAAAEAASQPRTGGPAGDPAGAPAGTVTGAAGGSTPQAGGSTGGSTAFEGDPGEPSAQ